MGLTDNTFNIVLFRPLLNYSCFADMLNVLIVDDNSLFTERIIGMLKVLDNIKYIDIASDFNEACRVMNDEKPDLVLLDINLPGKSGIDFLRRIRECDRSCKVIMFSNHSEEYYRQLCKDLGADYFFNKSKDFSRVPEIVSHLN